MVILLQRANVGWLDLGLQTTNPQLQYVHRKNDIPFLLSSCDLLRDAGMGFNLDLIIGFPGDNKESMLESIRFVIEEAKPNTIKIFPLRVYPGTPIHDMFLSRGSSWLSFDNHTRLVKSTATCCQEEMDEFTKFCNTVVTFYRFLSEESWLHKEQEFRRLPFFVRVFEKVSALEYSDADIWHIMNCPQNAYDRDKTQGVWTRMFDELEITN